MAYLAVFAIGIGVGWVIFERPQWANDMVAWFKGKVGCK